MSPLIEFRTTISPTANFFRRIHFMAASLRALGGRLGDHELVVSVGGDAPREDLHVTQPWSRLYPIVWRWVNPQAYARLGYRATNRDRASHPARGRFVMLVDADVIFCRDFCELLDELESAPAIAGVMAHKGPFRPAPVMTEAFAGRIPPRAPDAAYWSLLAEEYGTEPIDQIYPFSGADMIFEDKGQRGPAYYNGGMVLGPRDLMERMCALYQSAEEAVDRVMTTYFRPQLARTLAMHKAGIAHRVLPMRYNYPNDPRFDARYPEELSRLAILHYLRKDVVDRDADFVTAEKSAALVARTDLDGSNEVLRRRVAELHAIVAEEEAP